MKKIELRTTQDVALGNGTRPNGTTLAVFVCPDAVTRQDLVQAAWDAPYRDSFDVPEDVTFELFEDVWVEELICALKSPCVEFRESVIEFDRRDLEDFDERQPAEDLEQTETATADQVNEGLDSEPAAEEPPLPGPPDRKKGRKSRRR